MYFLFFNFNYEGNCVDYIVNSRSIFVFYGVINMMQIQVKQCCFVFWQMIDCIVGLSNFNSFCYGLFFQNFFNGFIMFGSDYFWRIYIFQVINSCMNYVDWVGGIIGFSQNVMNFSDFQNGVYCIIGDDIGIFGSWLYEYVRICVNIFNRVLQSVVIQCDVNYIVMGFFYCFLDCCWNFMCFIVIKINVIVIIVNYSQSCEGENMIIFNGFRYVVYCDQFFLQFVSLFFDVSYFIFLFQN